MNCWATGSDDAGWNLIAQSSNSEETPWISLQLTSEGPDLQVTKVSFEDDFIEGEEITATIQLFNSGERITESFNVSVFMNKGDTTELVALKQFDGLDTSESTNMRAKFTIPASSWNLEIIIDSSNSIAELNEENIAENEAQIKENAETIQDLDKKVSIVELKIDSMQDDIRGARADTTLIINMLRESSK